MRVARVMKAMPNSKKLQAKHTHMKGRVVQSKIGKMFQVLKGTRDRTSGRLRAEHLMKSKRGKVVSKRKSAQGKRQFKHIVKWVEALGRARKDLGLRGFHVIKKGSALHKKAKELLGTK